MSRISIIIPVLNEAATIDGRLSYLLALKADGHELVFVDGGSHDGTPERLRGAGLRVISGAPGRARQMNLGAAAAQGDVLLFLHIDTLLPANFSELTGSGVLGHGMCWGRFDVSLSGRQFIFRVIETAMNLRSRITSVATGDQAIFVSRELFDTVGGFPDLPLMEDVAISKRLRRHCAPVNLNARVQVSSRRWEQHGVFRTMVLMWWLRLLYVIGVSPVTLHRWYYGRPKVPQTGNVLPASGRLPSQCQRPEQQTEPQSGRLLIFAKAPVAGKVKTRLSPLLDVAGALALHESLIRQTWQTLAGQVSVPAQMWVSQTGYADFFDTVCGAHQQYIQQGADLGQRMLDAALRALQEADFVVIVGADCPSVDAAYVEQAISLLRDGVGVVLGPAEDGGYVLLGLRKPVPESMFTQVEWGTDQVLRQTRRRLESAGVPWQELDARWDVDRPEDLLRFEQLTGLQFERRREEC